MRAARDSEYGRTEGPRPLAVAWRASGTMKAGLRRRLGAAIAALAAFAVLLGLVAVAGAAFSAPVNLSAPGRHAFSPRSQATPTATRSRSGTASTARTRVQARTISAAGVLGPIRTLSAAGQDADDPQIASDADGDAVAVWSAVARTARPGAHDLRRRRPRADPDPVRRRAAAPSTPRSQATPTATRSRSGPARRLELARPGAHDLRRRRPRADQDPVRRRAVRPSTPRSQATPTATRSRSGSASTRSTGASRRARSPPPASSGRSKTLSAAGQDASTPRSQATPTATRSRSGSARTLELARPGAHDLRRRRPRADQDPVRRRAGRRAAPDRKRRRRRRGCGLAALGRLVPSASRRARSPPPAPSGRSKTLSAAGTPFAPRSQATPTATRSRSGCGLGRLGPNAHPGAHDLAAGVLGPVQTLSAAGQPPIRPRSRATPTATRSRSGGAGTAARPGASRRPRGRSGHRSESVPSAAKPSDRDRGFSHHATGSQAPSGSSSPTPNGRSGRLVNYFGGCVSSYAAGASAHRGGEPHPRPTRPRGTARGMSQENVKIALIEAYEALAEGGLDRLPGPGLRDHAASARG